MDKIKFFIGSHLLQILLVSLITGVVSCTIVSLLDAPGIWFLIPAVLGAPVLIFFLYLIFIGFQFFFALIKDKIHNLKTKRNGNNNK